MTRKRQNCAEGRSRASFGSSLLPTYLHPKLPGRVSRNVIISGNSLPLRKRPPPRPQDRGVTTEAAVAAAATTMLPQFPVIFSRGFSWTAPSGKTDRQCRAWHGRGISEGERRPIWSDRRHWNEMWSTYSIERSEIHVTRRRGGDRTRDDMPRERARGAGRGPSRGWGVGVFEARGFGVIRVEFENCHRVG